jgi:putative transposase
LFFGAQDYAAFVRVLVEALREVPTRLLAFCLMPNHWHLVIWVSADELPRFMHWLTMTHAKRWHKVHGSEGSGPVYQNRYYAAPVQSDHHLLNVIRYVERNALRAGLVRRAEDWPWTSLWHRCTSSDEVRLSPWPVKVPDDWVDHVNEPHAKSELAAIREAVTKGTPIGSPEWSALASQALATVRRRPGRPPKTTPGVSFQILPQCKR